VKAIGHRGIVSPSLRGPEELLQVGDHRVGAALAQLLGRGAAARHRDRQAQPDLARRGDATRRTRTFKLIRAGKLTARQTLALRIGAPPKGQSKAKGGLTGRYFWRTLTRVDYAWDNRGIAFVDDHWAYKDDA
jgi:hypothetical protein